MTARLSAERIILSRSSAARALDISPRTFDEWRKMAGFPEPLKLPGYPRWRECDIRAWIDSRMPVSPAAAAPVREHRHGNR